MLLGLQEIQDSIFKTSKFPLWATMWQIELHHSIKTEASFVSPSAWVQWRRLRCEASMFVFINHAAKTADYTRDNQCDVPEGWEKRRWGKMKREIKIPSRQSMKCSRSEWSGGFYLSRLTITLLSGGKSGVSVFAVACTYRKEIRMKYWYCPCRLRGCLFQHVCACHPGPN